MAHFFLRFSKKSLVELSMLLFLTLQTAQAESDRQEIKARLKAETSIGAEAIEAVRLYAESHALVIGIEDYRNGWPKISNAVKEAEAVAHGLSRSGFDVTLKKDLSYNQLKQAFEDFFIVKGKHPEARLLVWFGGHGFARGADSYLVSVDTPLPMQGPVFELAALSMRRVSLFMRIAKAKHIFAAIDAGLSGADFDNDRGAPRAQITRLTMSPVRQLLVSKDFDQAASSQSLFAEFFLKALTGEENADFNHDGYLTGTEISFFVTDRLTHLTNGKQIPCFGKLLNLNFNQGDFVFVFPKELPSAAKRIELPAAPEKDAQKGISAPSRKNTGPLPPLSF